MTTDAELLQRHVRDHSEAAFAELVQRHLALVYSTALRQVGGDAHLAQDVAQTVFTALARKAAALSGHTVLAGWLYLGTHHASAQAVRSIRRRRTREQEAHAMEEIVAPDTPPTDWDRVRPVLDDALRALGETDREAVLLRFFERRAFADIGAALNLSDDAARMRVDRALGKLRDLLGRRGITSTTAALSAALGQQAMVAAPAGLAATITGTALSAVAGGAVVATTTGFFMSTTTAILTAVALATTGTAIYQTTQAHRADEALATVTREHAALSTRLRSAEQQAARTALQNEKLQRDFDQLFTAKTAPVSASKASFSTSVPASTITTSKGILTLSSISTSSDPAEARRQVRAYNLRGADIANRPLYRLLGFTPAQQEQYMGLVAEGMDRVEARSQAMFAQFKGLDNSSDRTARQAAFDQIVAQSVAEQDVAVQATFGEAAAQTIQRYRETVPVREVAKELASALFYTDTPLTTLQAEQLVDLMARHSRTPQGRVDLAAMDVEAIAVQAQAVLAGPQLAGLRFACEQVRAKWVPATPARGTVTTVQSPGK